MALVVSEEFGSLVSPLHPHPSVCLLMGLCGYWVKPQPTSTLIHQHTLHMIAKGHLRCQ